MKDLINSGATYEPTILVPKLGIVQGSLNLLIGMSGAGKTTLAYALACHAAGTTDRIPSTPFDFEWKCDVAIIDFEVKKSPAQMKLSSICKGEQIQLSQHDLDYFRAEEISESEIDGICEQYQFVIIDHLDAMASEVWKLSPKLRKLRRTTEDNNCTILLIHHGAKSDNNSNRGITAGSGSQTINNSAETITHVKRGYDDTMDITQVKNAYSDALPPFKPISLEIDKSHGISFSETTHIDRAELTLQIVNESTLPLTCNGVFGQLKKAGVKIKHETTKSILDRLVANNQIQLEKKCYVPVKAVGELR